MTDDQFDDIICDGAHGKEATDAAGAQESHESTANATWSRMLAGNRRFAEGKAEHPWQDPQTRESLIDRQNPDAAVLACADSRVSPEIVFDAGLGDLFTIRTAGQIVDDAVIASLEYAVDKLHVSLIAVMGHESCAAIDLGARELDAMIAAATDDADSSIEAADRMADLDERIAASDSIILREAGMSVWQAREAELDDHADFERVHIARTIEEIVMRSDIIPDALAHDRLMIVGARYQLESGKVEVLSF